MDNKFGLPAAKPKKKPVLKYQNPVESLSEKNNNGNEGLNWEEFLRLREEKVRRGERRKFEITKQEEKIIFSRDQEKIKVQLESIQTQIKELVKEQTGVMEEVKKATFETVVNPGIYHQNFFEKILQLLIIARKKLSESKTWLQVFNSRVSRKNYYRNHFKKSGTQFSLSNERTVATQTG